MYIKHVKRTVANFGCNSFWANFSTSGLIQLVIKSMCMSLIYQKSHTTSTIDWVYGMWWVTLHFQYERIKVPISKSHQVQALVISGEQGSTIFGFTLDPISKCMISYMTTNLAPKRWNLPLELGLPKVTTQTPRLSLDSGSDTKIH